MARQYSGGFFYKALAGALSAYLALSPVQVAAQPQGETIDNKIAAIISMVSKKGYYYVEFQGNFAGWGNNSGDIILERKRWSVDYRDVNGNGEVDKGDELSMRDNYNAVIIDAHSHEFLRVDTDFINLRTDLQMSSFRRIVWSLHHYLSKGKEAYEKEKQLQNVPPT